MTALASVILPVFLVLGLGYLAAARRLISEAGVDGLMRFAQSFALPLLLMQNIAALDLGRDFSPRLLAAFFAGAFAGFALAFTAARLAGRPLTDSVAIGFAGLFSNTLLLGLPLTERAFGPGALTGNYVIISLHSPLLYGFGITAMELARAQGKGLHPARIAANAGRAILTQPLVMGILAGFALNFSGLALPQVAAEAVAMLTRAALPVALFGLGGVLWRYRPEGEARLIAAICAASLLLHPLVTWALATPLALDTPALRSATLTAAMAPGVNAYLFAHMYGVAQRTVAASVLIATALTLLTGWFWLAVVS